MSSGGSYNATGTGSSGGGSSSSSSGAVDYVSDSSHTEDGSAAEGLVLLLSVCLLIGCVCRWLVQRMPRVPLPFTVLLLFVGVIMGSIAQYGGAGSNVFSEAISSFSNLPPHLGLYIFLPVLIFDSAFNVHFHLFAHSLWSALLLAFPGALIALFFAALFGRYVFDYGWSWSEALQLGAILAATDPVAVVGLLRDLGSSASLATLIEAESLLNDGSAFVVYLLTQSILIGDSQSATSIVGSLFQYALGGPAFGLLFGWCTIAVMNTIYNDAEIEISITIGSVYLCFWIADSPLGLSAVLAVVVMGLYMAKHRYAVSPSVQPNLTAVWSLLIFAVNIFIFVLSGLIISAKLITANNNIRGLDVAWLFLLYALLHVVRFLSVLIFLPLFRRTNVHLSMREVVMISWSGMRGGVCLLLALTTYLQPAYDQVFRDRLTFHVCGIVLLTLVVNGMTSRYVLQALGLNKGTAESRLVLRSALDHMRQQTAQAMREMKGDRKFAAVEWTALRPFLPSSLIVEVQQRDEQLKEEQRAEQQQRKLERRATMKRMNTGVGGGEQRGGKGGVMGDGMAGEAMDQANLQSLIFPPSHPIHRMMTTREGEMDEQATVEPGDLTLMNMPTLQYQEQLRMTRGPLSALDDGEGEGEDERRAEAKEPSRRAAHHALDVEREDDDEDGVDGEVRLSFPPVYSATVGGGGSSGAGPSRLSPHQPRRPFVRHVANKSSLMSIFDAPNDEDQEQAMMHDDLPSPSRDTLTSSDGVSHPPAGPTAPGAPPPPPPPPLIRTASVRTGVRQRWNKMYSPRGPAPPLGSSPPPLSPTSRRILSPLRPPARVPHLRSAHQRRRYLHHRQLSSQGELHLHSLDGSDLASVDDAKKSLHRELCIRFITALQADYHRQFSAGLVTRRSLRLLTAACDHGIDEGSLVAHWDFLHRQLRCPRWLSTLYSSRVISRVDGSRWTAPLRSLVQSVMFSHLKTSVELATAFLSAQQRLEFVLDSFPEFSSIDAEVIASVQRQAGALQSRALTVWVDVSEGYHEAHAAVVTRHAAVLLLHFQQSEIRSLHATGMLEQREFDLIIALINSRLLRLERSGISIPMTAARDLFLSLPLIACLTPAQQRRLIAAMQDTRARQWYENHQTLWDRGQRPLGLVIPVRGTMRLLYEYQTQEDDEDEWDQPGEAGRGRGGQREVGSLPASLSRLPSLRPAARSASSFDRHLRYYDTQSGARGGGGMIGAFEMLTGQATLALCSTVTMAEAFVLDRHCVELLCEEEESLHLLTRSAAESLLKAQWRKWAVQEEAKLKQYQVHELVQRAHVNRSPPTDSTAPLHTLELRFTDVLLILTGSARGSGMRRKVKRRRTSLHSNPPTASSTVPARSSLPSSSSSSSSSPLYLGPCWLRRRCGRVVLAPSTLYLQWTERDEEISSLFPPPPRADMKSYAKELGLTMRLAQQHHQLTQQSQPQPQPLAHQPSKPRLARRMSATSARGQRPQPETAGKEGGALPPLASQSPPATAPFSPPAPPPPVAFTSSTTTLPLQPRSALLLSHSLVPYLGARRRSVDDAFTGERRHSGGGDGQQQHQHQPQPHKEDKAEVKEGEEAVKRKRVTLVIGEEKRSADEGDTDGDDEEVEVEEDELEFDGAPPAAGWGQRTTGDGPTEGGGAADAGSGGGDGEVLRRMAPLEIEQHNALTV